MYVGTKGWYISELKKVGITKHEGYKLETYKTHVLFNLWKEKVQSQSQ